MKNLCTVIKFTIKEMIRKKAFIVSTLLILALIVVGFSIPKIIETLNNGDNSKKIIVADKDNLFEGNIGALNSMNLPYKLTIENSVTFEEIKNKIKEEAIDSAIILEKEGEGIKLRYIVENVMWEREVPEDLFKAITSLYSELQINKLGLTQEQLKLITPNIEPCIEQTSEDEINQGNVFVMLAMSMALSISIIFFTSQVALSITTEKTSKIMETLVTSTSPRTIVLGKTIGIGIIGLIQIILIAATAWISANQFLGESFINTILDNSNLTPAFVIVTLLYFILGYFAYALLYALTGSLVTKPEDIQSANTPVSLIAMIGFYLGYFSIGIDPTSSISSFASMFPISSAFCMPSRLMMGLASWSDVAISLVLLVLMVAIIAKIAIKVYSNAILNYGSKMSLKDAIKLYKEK